ncbi:hypothetical protein [Mesorhizobium sp. B2-1-2]|uniref:hypothetical protein n=1 Tax=Mesorhizobium sp. B2-1-2 TaxID=2589973 RepID=UPI00112D9D19|nr:hypothetical protein [Mesorhizobium sp. B2-1-2]TPN04476.1 hypothetical protein FJ971_29465 [Mesorhizobium sp. B2-1-2]
MSSSRKYWSTEELEADVAYWRRQEAFADKMIKLTWERSGYQSPRWSLHKNKAVMNRQASESFLAQRQVSA